MQSWDVLWWTRANVWEQNRDRDTLSNLYYLRYRYQMFTSAHLKDIWFCSKNCLHAVIYEMYIYTVVESSIVDVNCTVELSMLLCQLIRLTDEAILGDLQRITQLIWSNAKYKLINQIEEFLYGHMCTFGSQRWILLFVSIKSNHCFDSKMKLVNLLGTKTIYPSILLSRLVNLRGYGA